MATSAPSKHVTLNTVCARSGKGNVATIGVVSGVNRSNKKCSVAALTRLYRRRPAPGARKTFARKRETGRALEENARVDVRRRRRRRRQRRYICGGGNNECGATKPIAAGTFARRNARSPAAGGLLGKPRARSAPEPAARARRGARSTRRCPIKMMRARCRVGSGGVRTVTARVEGRREGPRE